MSLVQCRFNPAHKCKPGRLEIHEYKCPDRIIAENSHADYIPKTGYVKKPKVHYDHKIIKDIQDYIREENEKKTENTNKVNASNGGNQRKIVGLAPKKKKNRGYYQDKELIDDMIFPNKNEEDAEFGIVSNNGILSGSSFQEQKAIDEELEIDKGNPLRETSNNENKLESNISVGELYDPNEEDRFIEAKNKNWINLKEIKSKLQNRN